MPYIDYGDKKTVKIWEGISGSLHHTQKATMAQLILEKGAKADMHHHKAEQWSHVLEGELLFNIDGNEKLLTPGMCAIIPSNVPHSALAVTKCKVLDCFLPFRQDLKDLEANP